MPESYPELPPEAGEILAAYDRLAPESGQPVPLAELRHALRHIPRRRLDEILSALAPRPAVNLTVYGKERRLSREDRDAALRLHGQDMHLLTIGEAREWWETAPGERVHEDLTGARPIAPDRVLDAYRQLGHEPGAYIPIADIRQALRGVRRVDLDATLIGMYTRQQIDLVPRGFRHRLTPADEAAALRCGGEYKHLLSVIRRRQADDCHG